jgi:hypothetical protein
MNRSVIKESAYGCNSFGIINFGETEVFNLPKRWKAVLDAVIDAPLAWQAPKQIAARLGWNVEETTDLLSTMDVEGWIVVWETCDGPLITLSLLAAERLHVSVIEVGCNEIPRWSRPGDPSPPLPRGKQVPWLERNADLHRLLDPSVSPDLAAETAEHSERLSARAEFLQLSRRLPKRLEDLPPPSRYLGLGPRPWPGPGVGGADAACPVCDDRPLLPHMYCLYCDRWGLDELAALVCQRAAWSARKEKPRRPCRSRLAPVSPDSEIVFPLPEAAVQRRPRTRPGAKNQIKREQARRKASRKAKQRW